MKRTIPIIAFLVACGGAPEKVTIHTQQEYENVVTELIKSVIEIFKNDGMNCELLGGDLRDVKKSPKLAAAHDWSAAHPEAKESLKEKIASYKTELLQAAAPGFRQCGGQLQSTVNDLTQ